MAEGASGSKSVEWAEYELKRRELILHAVSTVFALGAGVWVVSTYVMNRNREIELRKHELNLMLFREKKEAYTALIDAATLVTVAPTKEEAKARSAQFFKVYYGRVHVVPHLDDDVWEAKIVFANGLRDYLKDEKSNQTPEAALYSPYLEGLVAACKRGCEACLNPPTGTVE